MNKLSYEVMDVTELENVMGGSEIKYVGCVITNGKCSTDGGCGICNGKCNGSIDQGSTDSKPIEKRLHRIMFHQGNLSEPKTNLCADISLFQVL